MSCPLLAVVCVKRGGKGCGEDKGELGKREMSVGIITCCEIYDTPSAYSCRLS